MPNIQQRSDSSQKPKDVVIPVEQIEELLQAIPLTNKAGTPLFLGVEVELSFDDGAQTKFECPFLNGKYTCRPKLTSGARVVDLSIHISTADFKQGFHYRLRTLRGRSIWIPIRWGRRLKRSERIKSRIYLRPEFYGLISLYIHTGKKFTFKISETSFFADMGDWAEYESFAILKELFVRHIVNDATAIDYIPRDELRWIEK